MAKKHSASEFCSDETLKDLWDPLRRTIYKQNYERHSARRNESRSKAHSSKAYSRRNSDTVSECVSSRQQKWETVCCSKVRLFPYCDKKKIAQFALIMKLNRGGLSIPTGLTRTVCRYCYLVFSMLTAASSRDLFLKGTKSQRDALIQIAFNFLSRQCENLMSETCQRCLIPVSSLSKMLLKVCANTMLYGFQRKKNDEISWKRDVIMTLCK